MTKPQILPPIGLGTFRLRDQAVIDSVKSALELGYRHIDTASFYDNEETVGKVMQDPVLTDIGQAHNAGPAQITLAWVAQRDIVVIPSSTKPGHQKANLEAMKIKLSEEEMRRIDALDKGERIANPDFAPHWD